MELIKVNHIITEVRAMLDNLVDEGTIGVADRQNLLPMIVKHAIRNDSIDIEGM